MSVRGARQHLAQAMGQLQSEQVPSFKVDAYLFCASGRSVISFGQEGKLQYQHREAEKRLFCPKTSRLTCTRSLGSMTQSYPGQHVTSPIGSSTVSIDNALEEDEQKWHLV